MLEVGGATGGLFWLHQQHQALGVISTRLHSDPTTTHPGLHHLTAETTSRRRVEEVPCADPGVAKCMKAPGRRSSYYGTHTHIVQELCESRGSRPVRPNEPSGFRARKELLNHWSQLVPNMSTDI